MSYKSGFYKGRLGIGLANNGGDGTGNPRFPLDVNGDIRLTGSLLRSDGTPYLGGGLINYIPKGIKSVVNNDGGYYVGFGTHTPTEALDISGNLKVSGQILSVDGDNFSTVVPITQQKTTTENPTWHGDVTTTVSSSSDSASGLALKENIASPTFTGTVTIPNLTLTGQLYESDGVTPRVFSNWTVHSNGSDLYRSSGNVGIGTTSPGEKLQVNGNISISGSGSFMGGDINESTNVGVHLGSHLSTYGHIQIVSSNDNGGWIDFIKSDSGNADYRGRIRYGTGAQYIGMRFYTDTTERMIITNTGDFIMNGKLTFNEGRSGSYGLGIIQAYDEYHQIILRGNRAGSVIDEMNFYEIGDFVFSNGGTTSVTERMRINSDGNVGIGTSSPETLLHIHKTTLGSNVGGSEVDGNKVRLKITGSADHASPGIELYEDNSNETHSGTVLKYDGEGNKFKINMFDSGTERECISIPRSTGNVGIGTTSPFGKLDIKHSNWTQTPTASTMCDMLNLMTSSPSTTGEDNMRTLLCFADGYRNNSETKDSYRVRCRMSGAGFDMIWNSSATETIGTNTTKNNFIFHRDWTAFMNKNVGIGITDPERTLHLYGNRTDIVFERSGSEKHYIRKDGDFLRFRGHDDSTVLFEIKNNTNGSNVCSFPNGKVGIGTTNPAGKLSVVGNSGGTGFTGLQYTDEGVGSSTSTTELALYVNGEAAIYGSLRIASDARIKTNIVDVSDNLALEMVRNIPCRYYEYRDKLNRGTQKTIGFIAQEVKEIMPMAVSVKTDIIPNEMRNLTDLSWNNTILYTDLSDCSGIKYRFYVSNDISGNDETMKEVVGNADNSFTFDQSWNNVFCYGKEVDDFHTLDKQKLFALNFSATQELDRKVTSLETENQELKTEVATLKAELAAIKAHLGI